MQNFLCGIGFNNFSIVYYSRCTCDGMFLIKNILRNVMHLFIPSLGNINITNNKEHSIKIPSTSKTHFNMSIDFDALSV
jgi:hypothetical protein